MSASTRIRTVLVANRGEIALRVMRTAQRMGLRTVAVYSDADAGAPHVAFADAAMRLGPAPVGESYLNIEAVLEAARASGADAIHPGYGFLSENAAFAAAVKDAGLIFVGPPVAAIEAMGDKARAKRAMIAAGVPCIPGYEGEDQADEYFIAAAEAIGFPVMVKAAAGGGGRGMRLVDSADDLRDAVRLARSEATNAFGSGDLILEKAIVQPRHVEIQVFADAHGTTIHLGERDCSVQRRHQKVFEEAPCPVLTEDVREAMGAAAVAAADAVNYRGAGTVEFLLDADGGFYFLEMNTRLQVEHPVTELVTGLDLVELQLRVANGEPLGLEQADVTVTGHAIEARLYAEDPALDFQPATGPVLHWQAPDGDGVRCDAGIATGGEVTSFYDAMVAKVMAWGPTRETALQRLAGALERTSLLGVTSNQAFLAAALAAPAFARGEATTAFIAETFGEDGFAAPPIEDEDRAVAAVLLCRAKRDAAQALALNVPDELLDWSSSAPRPATVVFDDAAITVTPLGANAYRVDAPQGAVEVTVRDLTDHAAKVQVAGAPREYAWALGEHGAIWLRRGATTIALHDAAGQLSSAGAGEASGDLTAPMHGALVDVAVKPGDRVAVGDVLAVLEAMKMQHQLLASVAGTVSAVFAEAGAQVAAGDLIVRIREDDDGGR